MDDTPSLSLNMLHSEEKPMPLDLSCKKVGDEEDRDDDVILTLEIPALRNRVSHDPIVIPSESDSDSDVTVVAVNVNRKKSRKTKKPIDCSKIGSDTDSDGNDCILSLYQNPREMKKFYDHSSIQTSIIANDVLLDPIVKGKDPFLSDASSGDDLPNVSLMIAGPADSIANDNKNVGSLDFDDRVSPISMHLGLLGSKNIIAPPTGVGCVNIDVVSDTSLVVDHADPRATAKLSSKLVVGSQPSIGDLMSEGSLAKSADLVGADCVSSDGLSFGITQLLSSPCKMPSTTLVKDSKSAVDVGSVFHVSPFNRVFPDNKQSSSVDVVVGKVADDSDASNAPQSSGSTSSNLNLKNCFRSPTRAANLLSRALGKVKPSSFRSPRPVDGIDDPTDGSSSSAQKKSNEDWKVVSNSKNKVILRRFEGKFVSPPLRRKRESPASFSFPTSGSWKKSRLIQSSGSVSYRSIVTSQASKANDDGSVSASTTSTSALMPNIDYDDLKLDTEAESKASYCYGCKVKVVVGHLSFCMAGHGCCGQCLQSQVKTLLAKGKKGTLKCRYVGCNSFYLVSQLRNSLPTMVVEILEEKLDREYCDNAARLMMQDVGKTTIADEDIEDRNRKSVKDDHNLPPGWEPMSPSEEYRLIDVVRGSDEYNYVSAAFHMTMNKPRASIVKIRRVQNAILWEFYLVKKKQMERDNGKPILEKSLFHGTQRNVVEAICRTNFDWRLCGVHGTMYGQGSYFARDANYSHVYTDQPKGCQTVSIHPSNHMLFNSAQTHHQITSGPPSAAQIIIQPFPGSSHSVSIAALQSCRFARLPVLNNPTHLSHGSSSLPPSAAQGSSVSTSGSVSAFSFPYWIGGNGNLPGSNKVGRNSTEGNAIGPLPGQTAAPHIHTMFVARVLVGEYTLGKAGYRKPPPIDPAQPYGRCYDACVNDMSNPSIFVIFNSAQCYPEYIIEYTNKGKDM